MKFFSREPKLTPVQRLRIAVKSSDTVAVRELLASHPELLDFQDEKGSTPLHWAAEAQDLSVVAALIDLGANVCIKDNVSHSPSDIASWFGEYRMGAYTDVSQKIVQRLKKVPRGS